MLKRVFKNVKEFILKITNDDISTYSAQSSFFIMLSLFPFIMLLLTLVKYTILSKSLLLSVAVNITPDVLDPLIISIIDELYSNLAGSALISISAILALWSASRGILSIIKGLNRILEIDDKRNYFVLRFIASIYTVLFIIAILLSLIILVFGRSIYRSLKDTSALLYDVVGFFVNQSTVTSIVILTLLFLVIYKALPAKKSSFALLIPGSLFTAIGWMISSYFFSLYLKLSPNFSYIYGSLSMFILLMLWIYIGMYILFLGCEVNKYFQGQMKSLVNRIKNRKNS